MNALGMHGFTFGIRSLQAAWRKIVGPVVTMRMIAAGQIPQKTHLGMNAIASARPGDVIVIDNGGRMDSSCWGGILADATKVRGVAATVICTARGRVIEESANQMIQCGGVQVRPGDIIFGDSSGIVCVPQEKMLEILETAEQLWQKEEDMIAEIKAGADILAVDAKYNYNKML